MRNTMRISCNMPRSSLIPASSRPIAVLMPRLSNVLSGAIPLRNRRFELQLWQVRGAEMLEERAVIGQAQPKAGEMAL